MCPPPLGPSPAWFMNSPQTNNLQHTQQAAVYHPTYQPSNYYPSAASASNSSTTSISVTITNNNCISENPSSLQHHHQNHIQPQQPPPHLHTAQQYSSDYSYHNHNHQHQPQLQHHQQPQQQQLQIQPQQQQQPQQIHQHHQHHIQQQQHQLHYKSHHHQQLLSIQPQSQHVHHQKPSPISHQSQISPISIQPKPSPTLRQHQQPSPGYQQNSPINRHLTSPSLQASPVLHHSHPQQQSPLNRIQPTPTPPHQPSPLNRIQPTPTPPHHTPTPTLSNQSLRSSSDKEAATTPNSHSGASCISPCEVRILELNRRLQCRPSNSYKASPLPNYDSQYDDLSWWEEFRNDFFKEDATLTIFMHFEEKPVRYVLSKTLISRFFRSYFDGGVSELSINLRNSREIRNTNQHQSIIVLECDNANIVTKNVLRHPKVNASMKVVVSTEGQLNLEFVGDPNQDTMMIKSWKFQIKFSREYIDRSIAAIGLPSAVLIEPTTTLGLPNSTLFFLKSCSLLESMQEIMSYHKSSNYDPRTCLKRVLFEKYGYKGEDDNFSTKSLAVMAASPSATKRRRKKANSTPTITNGNGVVSSGTQKRTKLTPSKSNNATNDELMSPTVPPMPDSMDIFTVGEPSSMKLEYHDDNERFINKIENENHVPSSSSSSNSNSSSCISSATKTDKGHNKSDSSLDRSQIDEKTVIDEQDIESVEDEIKLLTKSETNEITLPESAPAESSPTKDFADAGVEASETDISSTTTTTTTTTTTSQALQIVSEENSKPSSLIEDQVGKENNGFGAIDETSTNSTATQSDSHFNVLNSIPEGREDNCKPVLTESTVTKLPPSSNNKNLLVSGTNGTNGSNKQSRRRSSERKETLREGWFRTSDFVVAIEDLKSEHPALWRITTGNNLLQQFEPKVENGVVLYENTNQYAGWNHDIKKNHIGVDVKLTQHTRNQITVERLLLNFDKLDDAESFFDKHFVIYMQILISTALDPKFWEGIESEPKHHDYFITSRRIIEDVTKRFKIKLSKKLLKLSEAALKNVEKYPNLVIKPTEREKEQQCRSCNTNTSTQVVTFGNRTYDLHSYKPVKVTSELSKHDDKDLNIYLCDNCLDIVQMYSEVHHMGWKFYNIAREKVEMHREKGKQIHTILDECLKDEDWLANIFVERDAIWSKVENIYLC